MPSPYISNLPQILAGPILRRVEPGDPGAGFATAPSLVTVWIALKSVHNSITLKLYDRTGTLIMTGTPVSTVALGTNLHIAVATVKSTSPQTFLSPDVNYYYDLDFGSGNTLNTPSYNGGANFAITSTPLPTINCTLPGFALPPSSVPDLRIIHGSCRKPHGGETPNKEDVMPGIEAMLTDAVEFAEGVALNPNTSIIDPVLFDDVLARKRPHQLFLTGDQIYADDVSQTLLAMLIDAAGEILDWDETPPGVNNPGDLLPGARDEMIRNAKFSTDVGIAHSHLVKLREFHAMYLFVWSDVVWPSAFPSFSTAYPGKVKDNSKKNPITGTTHTVLTKVGKKYEGEIKMLQTFKNGLQKIRRILANIPVYMILDDHEITDDWNISKSWQDGVYDTNNVSGNPYGNTLGTRIIQNGLASYFMFQGWGNNPELFNGSGLLTAIGAWRGAEDSNAHIIRKYLGLPNNNTNNAISKIPFHYDVCFTDYQVIVLDTRTERDYPAQTNKKSWGGGLMTPATMTAQVLTDPATPYPATAFRLIISAAPMIAHPFMEDFFKPLLKKMKGIEMADGEEWVFDLKAQQNIFEKLTSLEKVIVLSGDVHYGLSSTLEYWDQRSGPEKQAVIIQLIASSFKNETGATRFLSKIPVPGTAKEYLGWNYTAPPSLPRYNDLLYKKQVMGNPPVIDRDKVNSLDTPTNWQYRITFHKDNRTEENRGSYSLAVTDLPAATNMISGFTAIYDHRRRSKWDKMRSTVGHNNFGEITFSGPDINGNYTVTHLLWYSPAGAASATQLSPFTKITSLLKKPATGGKPIP